MFDVEKSQFIKEKKIKDLSKTKRLFESNSCSAKWDVKNRSVVI